MSARRRNTNTSSNTLAEASNGSHRLTCYDKAIAQSRRRDNLLRLVEQDIDKRRKVSYSHLAAEQRQVEKELYDLRCERRKHNMEYRWRESKGGALEDVARKLILENIHRKKETNDDFHFITGNLPPFSSRPKQEFERRDSDYGKVTFPSIVTRQSPSAKSSSNSRPGLTSRQTGSESFLRLDLKHVQSVYDSPV